MNELLFESITADIFEECSLQDRKWGENPHHSNVSDVLMNRPGGCDPQRMAEEYEIPSANRAKFICNNEAHWGDSTWASIAVEELCESIEAATLDQGNDLRTELVQTAAVIFQWIADLDRIAVQA